MLLFLPRLTHTLFLDFWFTKSAFLHHDFEGKIPTAGLVVNSEAPNMFRRQCQGACALPGGV